MQRRGKIGYACTQESNFPPCIPIYEPIRATDFMSNKYYMLFDADPLPLLAYTPTFCTSSMNACDNSLSKL